MHMSILTPSEYFTPAENSKIQTPQHGLYTYKLDNARYIHDPSR